MSSITPSRLRRRATRAAVLLSISLLSTTLPNIASPVAAAISPTETLPVEVVHPETPATRRVVAAPEEHHIEEGATLPAGLVEGYQKPDVSGWYGVPIMRERLDGTSVPAVEMLRLAEFGLTRAELAAQEVPTVPLADFATLTNDVIRATGVPEARLRELVPASSPDPVGYGAQQVGSGSLPIAVYYDGTLSDSRSTADSAWPAGLAILWNKVSIQTNRVSFYTYSSSIPGLDADVTSACDMQKMAKYEMGNTAASKALVIYSDGNVDGNWGVAIDGNVSTTYARGQTSDQCVAGAIITPAVIPSAYVRDDVNGAIEYAAGWSIESSNNVHDVLTAHEIAHVYGMKHSMARCWEGNISHTHKTIEAMTTATDTPSTCGTNWAPASRYHVEFNNYLVTANMSTPVMSAERDRFASCAAAGWCSTNASPSAVRNLTATPQADGSVLLNWTVPAYSGSTAIQGYCYAKSTVSAFNSTVHYCVGNTTSAVVPKADLVMGQPTYFYVRAYNSNGSSAFDRDGPRSNIAGATPNLSTNLTNIYFSSLPTTATANQVTTVCWTVEGSGSITSTRLHWGTTTAMSNMTPIQTGTAPNYFCADITAPSSGTIYVQARASNGTQNLATGMESIAVVTGGTSQNDCGTGGDAAGSHASATQIYPPISSCSAQLVSGTDTVDWYTFYVSYSYEATVSITPNGSADFDLCLYDPYGNQAQCSTAGTGATDTIANYDANAGGWWRAQVYIYSGTGSYSLSASVAGSSAGPFEIRNDDNEKDIEMDLDYSDDIAAKRFSIDPSWKTGRSTATLWIYGRAADCSASGAKWRLRINTNEIAQVNPCDKWSQSGSSWASFGFPFVWASTTQVNTVDFQMLSGNDWTTRNVFLAVDTDTNAGTSDIRQNSTWLSGELMWTIVLS